MDAGGNVYVTDTQNNTVRLGVFTQYGAVNQTSYVPPAQTGQLKVTLLPPEANGQWRFPWEMTWRNSGAKVTQLAPGNYPMEFRSLSGWLAIPQRLTLAIPPWSQLLVSLKSPICYPTAAPSDESGTAGSLTVNLGANPPRGAGWRFLGDTTKFFASNFTTNLSPGTYLIEFAGPFNGRATPPSASVQILPANQS